jgi:hypothetical protein
MKLGYPWMFQGEWCAAGYPGGAPGVCGVNCGSNCGAGGPGARGRDGPGFTTSV